MAKEVSSIKHLTDKRAHIPSIEEAGYEDANDKVSSGKKILDLQKPCYSSRPRPGIILAQ